jgi:hypothetical protein
MTPPALLGVFAFRSDASLLAGADEGKNGSADSRRTFVVAAPLITEPLGGGGNLFSRADEKFPDFPHGLLYKEQPFLSINPFSL